MQRAAAEDLNQPLCGVDQGAAPAGSRRRGAAERRSGAGSFVAVWLVLAWAVGVFQYMAKSNRNAHGPVLVAATVVVRTHTCARAACALPARPVWVRSGVGLSGTRLVCSRLWVLEIGHAMASLGEAICVHIGARCQHFWTFLANTFADKCDIFLLELQ